MTEKTDPQSISLTLAPWGKPDDYLRFERIRMRAKKQYGFRVAVSFLFATPVPETSLGPWYDMTQRLLESSREYLKTRAPDLPGLADPLHLGKPNAVYVEGIRDGFGDVKGLEVEFRVTGYPKTADIPDMAAAIQFICPTDFREWFARAFDRAERVRKWLIEAEVIRGGAREIMRRVAPQIFEQAEAVTRYRQRLAALEAELLAETKEQARVWFSSGNLPDVLSDIKADGKKVHELSAPLAVQTADEYIEFRASLPESAIDTFDFKTPRARNVLEQAKTFKNL